jgi:hypothetical protein
MTPARFRHLQDTQTPRKLLSHLPFRRAVFLRSAELHALTGYCKLIAKIVPKEMLISPDRPPDHFKDCETQADIALRMLKDLGVHDGGATPSMIEQATEAQLLFVATLGALRREINRG